MKTNQFNFLCFYALLLIFVVKTESYEVVKKRNCLFAVEKTKKSKTDIGVDCYTYWSNRGATWKANDRGMGNGWFGCGLGGIKGMGYNSYFWWKGTAWGSSEWWNGGGKGGGGGKVGGGRTWGGAGYVKPISSYGKGGGATDIEPPDDGKGTDIDKGRS
ncbi:glycine-rich cell wall structural protein 2 isoform X1 [Medicago truncatula]|uniref:glycine-rich cell wall structural protein 2 isoform X1 n=1 Tax=Medicago truncatula TaxID=3880 RepID=UPI000D2F2C4A|nr:glycine-rich cell wall structural protein 2 isoform X1 [Medicago truncatula]